LSANNYGPIVNGQPWPTNFRPYSQYPWNNPLPANPQNVNAAETSSVKAYSTGTYSPYYAADTQDDFSHPVYLASSSDPVVNTACGSYQYGCNAGVPATFHVPAKARPSGSGDAHMGIIQPDGTELDFWGVNQIGSDWHTGQTVGAGIASVSSIMGTGSPLGQSATNGAALAAGLIRFSELNAGAINHALFLVVPCSSGVEYPGTSGAAGCAGGIPMGAHIHLACDHACIDALGAAPAYLRPVLYALHDYGGYALDNGCHGSTPGYPCFRFESPTQYRSFGGTYPGDAFAAAHGWTNGGQSIVAPDGVNWDALRPYIEVLSTCYALGTCSS